MTTKITLKRIKEVALKADANTHWSSIVNVDGLLLIGLVDCLSEAIEALEYYSVISLDEFQENDLYSEHSHSVNGEYRCDRYYGRRAREALAKIKEIVEV